MAKCHNCSQAAIIGFGPENLPLCVDCYLKMQQALDIQAANQERQLNQLTAEMESIAGLPGALPRYPERKRPVTVAGATFQSITVKDSTVGVINTGHLQQIDTAVTVIGQQGAPELASALKKLTEAIASTTSLDFAAQKEALDIVAVLSTESALPKEQRRTGVARPLISRLREVLSVAADLATIGQAALPLLAAAFGVQLS
jgi:hypothetical protein